MRLLLIEDDLVLQDGLLRAFENVGYAVEFLLMASKPICY